LESKFLSKSAAYTNKYGTCRQSFKILHNPKEGFEHESKMETFESKTELKIEITG
jgi:hypothetical protein